MTIKNMSTKPQAGTGFRRLTVHVNGPSVKFVDPLSEFKMVERPNAKNPDVMESVRVRCKKRIMNTLSFPHIQEKDVPSIIAEVKSKYSNLAKTRNMPEGIKWYLSWMK